MSVECLYFLCFVHSYFVSIGINISKMKSKFIFSDRDVVTGVKYMNSLFDQNYHFFSFYRICLLPHYRSRNAPLK